MKRMIKTAIAVATFGLAAAVAAPAVALSHNPAAVAVTPASNPIMGLLAADGSRDPISGLLGDLFAGGGNPLATVGGGNPLGGPDPLSSFGGLTGGIGNPVDQLTGSLSGVTGALPQAPASLPVVAGQPKAPGVLRTAAQPADVACMMEAIQAARAAVPVTMCEAPVGGMVRDAVHTAAQLTTLGKDMTGTLGSHGTLGAVTSGVRQPKVADVTQATQFGNLAEGVPALGDLVLLASVKPVTETAEAVAETAETVAGGKPAGLAVRPAVGAVQDGRLTSARATVGRVVKDVSGSIPGLSHGLTLDSPAVITN
ncbi:hypothetical protein [Acrocarpospora catenulata]|uniref:hypothetical protein n=1 Tax=Acrocarpospora catenulata TaxID=2836182 RepID=UPI001BDB04F0|nr:hypothetical protein [Acrocarpospora catenulata]